MIKLALILLILFFTMLLAFDERIILWRMFREVPLKDTSYYFSLNHHDNKLRQILIDNFIKSYTDLSPISFKVTTMQKYKNKEVHFLVGEDKTLYITHEMYSVMENWHDCWKEIRFLFTTPSLINRNDSLECYPYLLYHWVLIDIIESREIHHLGFLHIPSGVILEYKEEDKK